MTQIKGVPGSAAGSAGRGRFLFRRWPPEGAGRFGVEECLCTAAFDMLSRRLSRSRSIELVEKQGGDPKPNRRLSRLIHR